MYLVSLLSAFSLVTLALLYSSSVDIPASLSPQGCRMSWMSPSYILQSKFDASWTPLTRRYSLWLYREVGWEDTNTRGLPVLFIPGNAGSSHQVRSIASSATRQYFSSPYVKADWAREQGDVKALDFYAVEFNEDLSAFHGPTLESQTKYTSAAIKYILSLYPTNTSILVLGHSMGGIVATSLLSSDTSLEESDRISAVITMSTPHVLPPARFDARVDKIYRENRHVLMHNPTPILSICGGATDELVASESCVLPDPEPDWADDNEEDLGALEMPYRRTVFTSALEGAWTGVGHREMVWCHQVRWRVARAALELGGVGSESAGVRRLKARTDILNKWLTDGRDSPSISSFAEYGRVPSNRDEWRVLSPGQNMQWSRPIGGATYLFEPSASAAGRSASFVLYVSQGSIGTVGPQHTSSLRTSIYACQSRLNRPLPEECTLLALDILKLVPSPVPGKPFPVPDEGSDESDGVVMAKGKVSGSIADGDDEDVRSWILVDVRGGDGRGWVAGGLVPSDIGRAESSVGTLDLLFGDSRLELPASLPYVDLRYPKLLSNALLVYSLTPEMPRDASCQDVLLPPLLQHISSPSELHYHRLTNDHPVHLHSHSSAPFIVSERASPTHGLNLTVFSTGDSACDVRALRISIDWWGSIGRWGSRYVTTLVTWCIAIVVLLVFDAWSVQEKTGRVPTVTNALGRFCAHRLWKIITASFIMPLLPLSESYYLGIGFSWLAFVLAPLLLTIATGLVSVVYGVLVMIRWILRRPFIALSRNETTVMHRGRGTLISMLLLFMIIFLFVPWQVAFLGCWMIHLHTWILASSSSLPSQSPPSPIAHTGRRQTVGVAIPLLEQHQDEHEEEHEGSNTWRRRGPPASVLTPPSPSSTTVTTSSQIDIAENNARHNAYILLLMTWLLPLVAPVLAVWIRTLMTAGWTVPFQGDHNFVNVAPFLVLVDFVSWTQGAAMPQNSLEHKTLSLRWAWFILSVITFLFGSRTPYRVFEGCNIVCGIVVAFRIGRRYWGWR